MADNLPCRSAVRLYRHYGLDLPGSCPRARRDDGRDDGGRQHAADRDFAARARLFHRGSDCQRIHRSHRRPVPEHAHRARPGAVRSNVCVEWFSPHYDSSGRTPGSPLMSVVTSAKGKQLVNAVMLTLTGVCTVVTVSILFFILGYLVYNGAASLRLSFFTNLPAPVGEAGGGMANAIVRRFKALLLASALGIPLGFLGGVYLSEYGGKTSSFILRYTTDLLNGVPSIVIGIFVYAMIVHRMKHYSLMAGGVALGIMMIPIMVRSTEEYLRAVPQAMREGALALGAAKWKAIT